MGGISLAGSQKVAGAQQRVRGLASAGGPGDLCSALCFGPWDLYLTLSFLDFKKGIYAGHSHNSNTSLQPWVFSISISIYSIPFNYKAGYSFGSRH